jgi:hypothetical protein
MAVKEWAIKDIEGFIKLAEKYDLRKASLNGLEIEFFERKRISQEGDDLQIPVTSDERMPTEDELLLYSTDAFDEIRSERE